LQEALSSKETELQQQLEELVRLRQAEGAREQVELSEGKRLRALADQLICKYGVCSFSFLLLNFCSPVADVPSAASAAVGLKSTEVTASGSGVLKGAADALAGAVAAAEGVCARASDLLRLVHEHLMPGVSEVPEVLDALVAAFGRKGERVSRWSCLKGNASARWRTS